MLQLLIVDVSSIHCLTILYAMSVYTSTNPLEQACHKKAIVLLSLTLVTLNLNGLHGRTSKMIFLSQLCKFKSVRQLLMANEGMCKCVRVPE